MNDMATIFIANSGIYGILSGLDADAFPETTEFSMAEMPDTMSANAFLKVLNEELVKVPDEHTRRNLLVLMHIYAVHTVPPPSEA